MPQIDCESMTVGRSFMVFFRKRFDLAEVPKDP
jgi:hypothetical protein